MADNYHHEQSVIAAAKRYAAADKSDPFTFARALCHVSSGVVGRAYHHEDTAFHKKGQLIDCFYDAKEDTEFGFGVVTTRYTNMVRP